MNEWTSPRAAMRHADELRRAASEIDRAVGDWHCVVMWLDYVGVLGQKKTQACIAKEYGCTETTVGARARRVKEWLNYPSAPR